MLEAKILFQGFIQNQSSQLHELPAFTANFGLGAACPHGVIVCHININHKFLFFRDIVDFTIRVRVENAADIDFYWHLLNQG